MVGEGLTCTRRTGERPGKLRGGAAQGFRHSSTWLMLVMSAMLASDTWGTPLVSPRDGPADPRAYQSLLVVPVTTDGPPKFTEAEIAGVVSQAAALLSNASYHTFEPRWVIATPCVGAKLGVANDGTTVDVDFDQLTSAALECRRGDAKESELSYEAADLLLVVNVGSGGRSSGRAQRRGGVAYAHGLYARTIVHEVSHAVAVGHASAWRPTAGSTSSLGPAVWDEYGNAFDWMGRGNGEPSAPLKVGLGWIPEARVVRLRPHTRVRGGGHGGDSGGGAPLHRVVLAAHDDPWHAASGPAASAGGGALPLAVAVAAWGGEEPGAAVWLSLRSQQHAVPLDECRGQVPCAPGVHAALSQWNAPRRTALVDSLPRSDPGAGADTLVDAPIAAGRSWTSECGPVHVTAARFLPCTPDAHLTGSCIEVWVSVGAEQAVVPLSGGATRGRLRVCTRAVGAATGTAWACGRSEAMHPGAALAADVAADQEVRLALEFPPTVAVPVWPPRSATEAAAEAAAPPAPDVVWAWELDARVGQSGLATGALASDPNATVVVPSGVHTATLHLSNLRGGTGSATVTLTVHPSSAISLSSATFAGGEYGQSATGSVLPGLPPWPAPGAPGQGFTFEASVTKYDTSASGVCRVLARWGPTGGPSSIDAVLVLRQGSSLRAALRANASSRWVDVGNGPGAPVDLQHHVWLSSAGVAPGAAFRVTWAVSHAASSLFVNGQLHSHRALPPGSVPAWTAPLIVGGLGAGRTSAGLDVDLCSSYSSARASVANVVVRNAVQEPVALSPVCTHASTCNGRGTCVGGEGQPETAGNPCACDDGYAGLRCDIRLLGGGDGALTDAELGKAQCDGTATVAERCACIGANVSDNGETKSVAWGLLALLGAGSATMGCCGVAFCCMSWRRHTGKTTVGSCLSASSAHGRSHKGPAGLSDNRHNLINATNGARRI